MVNKKLIDLAVESANMSTHHYKVGCVIFDKKKILSTGYNSSLKAAKKLHPKFQKWPGSIHAEAHAILSAKTDLNKSSMLVIRLNNANQFRMAKPCDWCNKYINFVGIKKVYYSISEYPYIKELII